MLCGVQSTNVCSSANLFGVLELAFSISKFAEIKRGVIFGVQNCVHKRAITPTAITLVRCSASDTRRSVDGGATYDVILCQIRCRHVAR
ncbi:hypothetical protein AHAS_Ahas18G0093500 [Arachis hypogaea]